MQEKNITQQPQPGARWVKAAEFKYEEGVAYHAKDSKSKGAGRFNSIGAFIWGDCTVTSPMDQHDLFILDESGAEPVKEHISREWLHEKLVRFALAYYHHPNKDIANDASEFLDDALMELSTEPAKESDAVGWIDAKEKLPEEDGRYLCYVEEVNCLGISRYVWNCSYGSLHGFTDNCQSMNVTHWMPLPEPPSTNQQNATPKA